MDERFRVGGLVYAARVVERAVEVRAYRVAALSPQGFVTVVEDESHASPRMWRTHMVGEVFATQADALRSLAAETAPAATLAADIATMVAVLAEASDPR